MDSQSKFTIWLRGSGWAILLIAAVQFALHLWTNAHDNLFRDELYYLATAQHLDFGYVEFPPFVALAAAFSRAVLGTTPLAIRILPALAGAAIVLLTADMVAMLGGGLAAQVLAAIAIAVGPVFIGSSGLLSMDPFDQLWWTLAAWVLGRLIRDQRPRLWLAFGVVIGFGLLTKLTIAFFLVALLIGLLLSRERRLLFNKWLIFGGLIAFAMTIPYLVWQVRHGFPVIEYTAAYSSGKTFQASPVEFFLQQVLTLNPFSLPLWLGGLYFVFFAAAGRSYRAFGWAYVFLYLFFMIQKTKFYWLSPAYPMLFAAGAYGFQLVLQGRPRLAWLRTAYTIMLAAVGLITVPMAIPILPPEAFIRMNAALGGPGEIKTENLQSAALPQNYADRYGWKEMAAAAKQAYDTLSPAEQAEACFLTTNYGEAGAIDLYGAALGLPRAISGHNSYYLWGPQGCSGKVLISIGRPLRDLKDAFESVEAGPTWSCKYCMPYENGAPIYIARGLKYPIEEAWPTTKDFN
jgi:4-amino-4-deoxy-L-arabinose transferase-like glycosyltransferase